MVYIGFISGMIGSFKIGWRAVTNAGKRAFNSVLESLNTVLNGIYKGIDDLFGKIASIPGAAQVGITGTNLAGSGFKADLIPRIDVTTNQSIRAGVVAERGATSRNADRMRGAANGIRRDADELAQFKQETVATQAAWEALVIYLGEC